MSRSVEGIDALVKKLVSKSFPNRFLILTIFWKHGRVVLQLIANQSVLNRPGRFDSYCFRKYFVMNNLEMWPSLV